MKTMHLGIISVSIVFAAVFLPQSHADEWGPLPSSYPENKTTMLSFSYLSKGQSANGTEGSIHIKLFDARTGLPIQDASFWMNVKRGDSQVMNSRFYTYSGSLTLNLQHGSDYHWTEAPDHDPIFIGGFDSKSDTINVDVQPLAKDAMYYFEIDLATFDEPKMILFKPSGIKFDATINSTIPHNQTIISSTFDMTPLEQLKSGTKAEDVRCADGFTLAIKAENGTPVCIHESGMARMLRQGWYAWNEKVGDTTVNTPDKEQFGGQDCAIPQPTYSIVGTSGFAKDDLPENGTIYPGEKLGKNLVGNVIQFASRPNSTAYIHFTYDFNPYPGSNCKVTTEDVIPIFNGNKPVSVSGLLGSPYIDEVNQTKIRTDVPYQKDKSDVMVSLTGVQDMNDHVVRVSYKLVTDSDAAIGKSYYINFWFRSGVLVTVGDNLYHGGAFYGGFS